MQTGLIMAFCFFTTMNLAAQVSVTIDTPVNGTQYCAEQETTEVVFTATAMDGATVVSGSNIIWNWAGPNSWTSTERNPELIFNDVLLDGDYMVTATFASGETASDTITITVDPTFDWECPSKITVTPNTLDDNCLKSLDFNGFEIDAVNCTGSAYTWDLTFRLDTGVEFDAENYPTMGRDIANSAIGATYGDGILYDTIPFGFHTLTIDLRSAASGIVGQCIIDVEVIESRNNLACNDLINLTLNNNCEALVSPDMILLGDYCFNLFGIDVYNNDTGESDGGIGELTLDAPGLYTVTITGQTGLSCWGQILAEDKSVPILSDCSDVEMFCSEIGSIAPGSAIRGFDRDRVLEGDIGNPVANDGIPVSFPLELPDIAGNINDIVLNFEADVDSIGGLNLHLTAPSGDTLLLLDLGEFSSSCGGNNINVCLSNNGELAYSMFGSDVHCRETQNAFIGSFRPKQSFSGLYNQPANDSGNTTWLLRVTNNGESEINIIEADLQVKTTEGNLIGIADVVQSAGCSNGQNVQSSDVQIGANCDNGYWEIIQRTWVVTNEASGLSSSCMQQINLKQWTLDDIIWPKSYDNLDQAVLNCDELNASQLNVNGVPLPSLTGQPSVPFGDLCGNFQVTSSDLTFDICGPVSKKTLRTWSVLDWCTGDIVQYEQTIKVVDDQPIVFSCVPDNITQSDADAIGYDMSTNSYIVGSNPYTCDGNWTVVYPLVFDNACDDVLTVEVYYLLDDDDDPNEAPLNGTYVQNNVVDANGVQVNNASSTGVAATIRNLPIGKRTWIKFVATDECGNTGECFTEVDVEDTIDPNPVCIEFTVVSIGEQGCGLLPAASLDNGSWDNCGVNDFKIRELSGGSFQDSLLFCCTCQLENRMVVLRVTDEAGNSNTCIVEVELQDNLPAMNVSVPQSLYTFDCGDAPVDLSSIIEQSRTEFAWVDNCAYVSDPNGMINLNVTVVNLPAALEPFEFTGCGTGSRSVRYEVRDQCNELIQTFNQTFRFENSSVNNPSTFQVTRWPVDAYITECTNIDGLEPQNLAANQGVDHIRWNTGACNDVAIGWDDVIFPEVEDACLKILRTWTVIDWCIVDQTSLAQGSRTHTQIIRIDDTVPPTIDVVPTFTMGSGTTTCLTQTDTTALVANIFDDCTDMFPNQQVTYSYKIDYADGTSTNLINSDDANGAYPFGTSIITWYAEDHCQNTIERQTRVIINDTKAPTPYCLGTVVTATMNTDGSASIWASDFDLGGFDNYTGNAACNNFNEVQVYFLNGTQKVQSLDFDCNDIPDGVSQRISLEVYFEDEYGNTDFCIVTLLLQDNSADLCTDVINGSKVAGNVQTLTANMLESVRVDFDNVASEFNNFSMTDASGNYAFNSVTSGNYVLKASMDDQVLNGVSTLDLVLIQRHVLGLATLDSPYKIIAADADNSGTVTAIDLLTLRKLILGVSNEFPNGQLSWRFPIQNQPFTDAFKPFPYEESVEIFSLTSDMNDQNFMGVKIGDVNLSAVLSAKGNSTEIESRGQTLLTLEIDEAPLTQGEVITVPVYAKDMIEVIGFQNTINFDASALTFVGVTSGALDMSNENVALSSTNSDLSISWNALNAVTYDAQTVLFNLEFDVNSTTQLSQTISMSSSVTKAEAYNSELEVMNVDLAFRGNEATELVLYQNVPNPFLEATDVRFSIPSTSKVIFTVYDVNGREILRKSDSYQAGNHTINLTRNEINVTGVMYYKIETDSGTASKKMIQIR